MNILLINHYAGCPQCGMEFRPYYLAKKWTAKGHKVLIVAATFSHLRKQNFKFEKNFTDKQIDGIDYLFVKTPEYQGNGLSRIKNILAFVRRLSANAKKIANDFKPDVVIASSTYPVDIRPSAKIARLAGAKLIYEIHDLWPLSPMELGGYSKYHPFIAWLQYYENYAYKHVDAVVSILPKTKEHCVQHGLKPEKWFCVPNGIVVEDWQNPMQLPDNHADRLKELKRKGLFLVGYTGNLGVANMLNHFIDSKKYLDDKAVGLILLGTGTEKENLKKLAQKYEDVYFFDPIDKKAIPEFLEHLDAVYIGLQRQPLFRFGVSPNKIFDYMMAQKPVIYAVEAGNNPVAEAGAGVSVEPENPQALAEAIKKLAAMPKEQLKQMGNNGKKYVLEHHDYNILAEKFLEIMKK